MASKRTLYGLGYSPWTEKARWALDHHGAEYTYHEHVPMLGEPLLRLKAGTLRGKVSVPMLADDSGVTLDSLAIARRAEELGSGTKLFPPGREAELERWNERGETALSAARTMVIRRTLESAEAQREALPSFVPGAARGGLAFMSRMGAKFLADKYGALDTSMDAARDAIASALDALRKALEEGPRLLGDLSYADIAMCAVLQGVKPVDDTFIHLSPATREVWTDAELARKYVDLIAWRDDLYRRHRRRVH